MSRLFPALATAADGFRGRCSVWASATAKLKEHYGIEVPVSAIRSITETHASHIHAQKQCQSLVPPQGVAWVIAETDGTMIPLVDTATATAGEARRDRRKTRTVRWKEARLSLAPAHGAVTPTFAATLGEPDTVGAQLLDCALRAGLGQTSRVHSVGDGAPSEG